MKRLLLLGLLFLLAPAAASAQLLTPGHVFIIPAGGDCTAVACASATRQMCRDTATSTTVYACISGFYAPVASLGSPPGGANTQVQFNVAGAFGGDAGLTYNSTTDLLTINGGILVPANVGSQIGGVLVLTGDASPTGTLTINEGGFTAVGDSAISSGDLSLTTGSLILTVGNVNVAGGSKVNLEAAAGDTYLIRAAATASLDSYKDGTLGWSLIGGVLQAPPCPASLASAPPGWCYDSATGDHVLVGTWRTYP
jgi:hypothetical protein